MRRIIAKIHALNYPAVVFLALLPFGSISAQVSCEKLNTELCRAVRDAEVSGSAPMFVKGDVAWLQDNMGSYQGRFLYAHGDIARVNLPMDEVPKLAESPHVVQIGWYPYTGHLLSDSARIHSRTVAVHAGQNPLPKGYQGEGVIIGFLDSGLDPVHLDFRHPSDSTTRIARIWDQNPGLAPKTPLPYGYGIEWDSADIDDGSCTHQDPVAYAAHGTHVAGVAAGNGHALGKHTGIAPKTTLIGVAIRFGSTFLAHVADGADYVYRRAEELGMPVVLNTSIGSYAGSHDGRDLAAQLINHMLEAKPGRALAAAAGNEGDRAFHVGYDLTTDTSFTWITELNTGKVHVKFYSDIGRFEQASFGIGVNHHGNFRIRGAGIMHTIKTLGLDSKTSAYHIQSIANKAGQKLGTVEIYGEKLEGRYGIEIIISPDTTGYLWSLKATGKGRIDLWSDPSLIGTSPIVSSGLPDFATYPRILNYKAPDFKQNMVSSWTCSDHTLAVANYYNRSRYTDYNNNLQIPGFPVGDLGSTSSKGPARDGRIKPDVAASGELTLAPSAMSYLPIAINNDPHKVVLGGLHRKNGGTSSASPIAAGVMALYLERFPEATWAEVNRAVRLTAYTDDFTGNALPDDDWGYGKVNAFGALTAERGCTDPGAVNYNPMAIIDNDSCSYASGLPEISGAAIKVYPNPTSGWIVVRNLNVGICTVSDISGRPILQWINENSHEASIDITHLPSGLYVIKSGTTKVVVSKL